MGKRGRQRARAAGLSTGDDDLAGAASTSYPDGDGNELELRGTLTAKARMEYAAVFAGGLDREDAWQRATELLFERLAVSWTIAGVRTTRQKELIGRYRVASPDERRFVRDVIRAHVATNFPELEAP